MSHRTAVLLSLALTLLVGLAIAGNRDRLLGAAGDAPTQTAKSSQVEVVQTPTTGPEPRIVEIMLPTATGGAAPISGAAERDSDSDENYRDDDDYEDDDHDDDHHDDDHEEDEDDD